MKIGEIFGFGMIGTGTVALLDTYRWKSEGSSFLTDLFPNLLSDKATVDALAPNAELYGGLMLVLLGFVVAALSRSPKRSGGR